MTGRRPRGEDGNALLEFVAISVVLLVPLVYLLVTVFTVQKATFGVTQAAREAGRAIATADGVRQGLTRARAAVVLALADQRVAGEPELAVVGVDRGCDGATGTAGASLQPGARFLVCLTVREPLPYADRGLFAIAGGPTVRVSARSLVVVDSYRQRGAP